MKIINSILFLFWVVTAIVVIFSFGRLAYSTYTLHEMENRRNSLSDEDKRAESVENIKKNNFGTFAGFHNIRIWENDKFDKDGNQTSEGKLYVKCSNVKAVRNYCRFTCEGKDYEFMMCEYEMDIPGGVCISPIRPDSLYLKNIKEIPKHQMHVSQTIFNRD